MTTFDELCSLLDVTSAERRALVAHLVSLRALALVDALTQPKPAEPEPDGGRAATCRAAVLEQVRSAGPNGITIGGLLDTIPVDLPASLVCLAAQELSGDDGPLELLHPGQGMVVYRARPEARK